ncbi:hypothetical protein ACMHYB_40575 [Sorangium sp. So ce1128]
MYVNKRASARIDKDIAAQPIKIAHKSGPMFRSKARSEDGARIRLAGVP